MKIQEYISKEEVKRVCRELGLQDWSVLKEPGIPTEEAEAVLSALDVPTMKIDSSIFKAGLEIELEHGTRYPEANVTNNHPLITGRIVVAHLKESMDYYLRLAVAEAEGDLFSAILAGDGKRAVRKIHTLSEARAEVAQSEQTQLKNMP
ncbi:MAG: hypothetical protein A2043_08295 [Candidatus Schekmanbacteria bacterium GWA2_38_9]|nr:MAG: hypothetical protein A2043_08295 [Candidatus Schekmanbacteria bacterium GWA2_38_9]OGL49546.1 MAG: hypothetical protein A3H37_02430 [Candidatus Schekmanbacteria bacterium RIFCSPLOWO2_02_FULL_38_14]